MRSRASALVTALALLAGLVAGVVLAAPAPALLPPSACTISGPLAPRFPTPVDPAYPPNKIPNFVQYQATNGSGTYAGVAVTWGTQMTFRVIRFATGRVSVLATFHFPAASVAVFDDAIKVVGIDGMGNVIVRVQAAGSTTAQQRYVGYRFDSAGRGSLLQDSPAWNSFAPVGVSWQGVVVGWARYSSKLSAANIQTVEWTGSGRGQVHLIDTQSSQSPVATNRRGDILYPDELRLTDGRSFIFGWLPRSYHFGVGATKLTSGGVYGIASLTGDDAYGVKWPYPYPTMDFGSLRPPRLISYLVWINAVSTYGDVVGEFPGNAFPDDGVRVLVTRTGKTYRLPTQFKLPYGTGPEPATVIDDYGRVVYTGTDGLPHLFSCPL